MISKIFLTLFLFSICSSNYRPPFDFTFNHVNNDIHLETKKRNQIINPNAEFSDSSILLLIKHEYSLGNKTITIEDFPEIEIESLEDLTDCKEGTYKKDVFQKVFKATLFEKNRENVLTSINALENNEYLDCAEPNYFYHLDSTAATGQYSNNQWAIENIELDKAWDISTGRYEVKVGVIDTGIDKYHQDLYNNYAYGYGDCFWDSGVYDEGDDINGHGTHVAGIIGADGHNTLGVSGVCWSVKMYSYRVSSSGYQTNGISGDGVISAISAANNSGIKILNMSFGSDDYSYSLYSAINSFDGLAICAAGNNGNSTTLCYPAYFELDNIISVGNSTSSNTICSSSNRHQYSVDLFAPGEAIYSTDSTYVNSFGYTYKTGTSMATPFVTGVAALMKSVNPSLTIAQLKSIILDTVDTFSAFSGNCLTGGRLNAYKALKAALPQYIGNGIEYQSPYNIIPSESQWFRFYGIAATYQYETTGSLNTEGALYIDIQNNAVASSNNGGLGNNFLFSYNSASTYIYYIKVTNIGNTTDSFNLKISNIHDHNYAASYEYVSSSKHRAYCSCGFSRLEDHILHIVPGQPGFYRCAGCGARIAVLPPL